MFSPKFCLSLVVFSISAFSSLPVFAQFPPNETFALHPKAGYLLGNNSIDFSSFAGLVNYCDPYSSHFVSNFSAGLFGEIPAFKNSHIGLGVGFMRRNSRFTSGKSYPERDTTGGKNELRDVNYENEVTSNLTFIEIQPEFRYTLLDNLFKGPFRAMGAARFVLPLQGNFAQTDRIVSPENATFATENGDKVREVAITGGDLPSLNSFGFGISAGIENLLKVGNSTHFTQQIVFDYNFMSVLSDVAWNPWAIRAELGLRFGFLKTEPIKPIEVIPPVPDTPVVVQTETPARPRLEMQLVSVDGVLQTGDELLASAPIVNAVFFEKTSSEIPQRYVRTSALPLSFENDAYALHRNILPKIAQIVFKNPRAKIVLEGATSGAADEPGGVELAKKRAEAVGEALKALGVPENSISYRQSLLPRNPSNQDYPSGREENRRVDITVQNAPLQEYVAQEQFAQIKGTANAEVTTYNIASSETLELRTQCSPNPVQTSSATGVKQIPFLCRLPQNATEFTLDATAFSSYAGRSEADSKTVSIESLPKEQIELSLDNFDAVLRFDYNSSVLSPENKELLKQMGKLLPAGSTITIFGSSDVTSGSEQRNAELSNARAKATEDFLKSIAGNKFTFETSTDAQKFSEDTPEGRFLNRSIRVRVRK